MRSSTRLRSALQPGSYSIVVTAHVEWATKTVHKPFAKPQLSMAFCACCVTSRISPSPWVSSVYSSCRDCMRFLQSDLRLPPRGAVYDGAQNAGSEGDKDKLSHPPVMLRVM